MKKYDVAILGGGPGGYVAAIRAAQLGKSAAIIDKDKLGGICLNWGCIPTKALLKNAEVLNYIKNSKEFGITIPSFNVNFNETIKRSREISKRLSKGIEFLMNKNQIDHIKGTGVFKSDKEIEVINGKDKELVKADKIIIATGARSQVLADMEPDGKRIITSKEAMNLKEIPKKMLVIGAGAIGVEFAYFYNGMGVDVTIVEFMPNIVPVEDLDVSKQLQRSFKKSGIKVMTKSSVEKVDTSGNGCKVLVKTKNGEETITCDVVLSAVGITANIENIGLEEVGIRTDNGRILVDDYYKTNINGYYAIGDVLPTQALAHVASAEGITCLEKIAGHNPEPIDYGNIPGCTYASPEIASVGMTEAAAKESGYDVKVGKFPFTASGKASAAGHKDGFVKVIFDAKYGEWLGCHMIGYNVTEMIAEAVVARKLETTGHEVLKAVHPHPTMSEAVMEAVAAAYDEVIHL